MKRYIEAVTIAASIALAVLYSAYLYLPLKEGEFGYFANLPAALSGLMFFFGKNIEAFAWTLALALSGLGLSFLILERGFKLRLPAGIMLGMGLGFLSLIIFFLGALHLLYPALIKSAISALALPGIYFSLLRLRGLGKIRAASRVEAALVFVFGLVLIMVLIHPSYFYDALTYYLALPRQYLLRNSIAPIPTISYSYFPEIGEMLYLAGLAVSGQVACQMVNSLFWLAVILLAREFFAILFGPERKILSTILLFSLPIFSLISFSITNDLMVAYFVLAGVYPLINPALKLPHKALLWGLAAGLACSTKLTSYIYMFLPQGVWLAYLIFKEERTKFLGPVITSAAAFLVICAPFWARNIITIGNPLYPALTGVLGGNLSPGQRAAIYGDAHGVKPSRDIYRELFRIPHEFAYSPISKGPAGVRSHPVPFLGTMMAAGLLALAVRKRQRGLTGVLLYSAVFYVTWAFSFRLSRFALGLWVILSILSGGGFAAVAERGKWHQRLILSIMAIAVMVSLNLGLLTAARDNGWSMLAIPESKEKYLLQLSSTRTMEVGAYPLFQWLNIHSEANDQVALLGVTSFFYLERKALISSFIDWNPLVVLFNLGKSPREICRLLNQDGVGYLVFQPLEFWRLSVQYPANRLTPAGKARMEEFFQSDCIEKIMSVQDDQILLYRILPRPNE